MLRAEESSRQEPGPPAGPARGQRTEAGLCAGTGRDAGAGSGTGANVRPLTGPVRKARPLTGQSLCSPASRGGTRDGCGSQSAPAGGTPVTDGSARSSIVTALPGQLLLEPVRRKDPVSPGEPVPLGPGPSCPSSVLSEPQRHSHRGTALLPPSSSPGKKTSHKDTTFSAARPPRVLATRPGSSRWWPGSPARGSDPPHPPHPCISHQVGSSARETSLVLRGDRGRRWFQQGL